MGQPRGTWAGYDVPQFSIHRGKLQKCLADAVRDSLGDAAHPMYPVGSNGASQAILDAVAIARHLKSNGVAGLGAYDQERRPATADIVRANRKGGPDGMIDLIEERAPDGFAALDDVASPGELRAIVGDYQTMAGYRSEQVNRE